MFRNCNKKLIIKNIKTNRYNELITMNLSKDLCIDKQSKVLFNLI